jgi:hypothetical protein
MPTSKSNSPGPEPGPAPIAIDAALADRLVAALEQIGTAMATDETTGDRSRRDGHGPPSTVDRTRIGVARDYNVLRGLLGRADAPQPLRMRRLKNSQEGGANTLIVADQFPVSAHSAVVESPGDGSSGPLREIIFDIDATTSTLPLTEILPTMPISRVEIFDRNRTLVAFGPSFRPIE